MKRILWGSFLVLLLAACGTTQPDLPQATNTFNFTVDPAAQSVKLAAAPAGALAAQAEDGSRVLVPGTDLSLEFSAFTFLPGNVLAIDAVFRNVSSETFTNLTFGRAAGSTNVVSSAEPGVVARLDPGESTGPLRFTVQHKGQPFTYAVEATATVGETGGADCTDPVNVPDPILKEKLREALEKPEGNITCADLQSLTRLSVIGSSAGGDNVLDYARNFEGLQYATNLTSLFLGGDSFSAGELGPIAGLKNLTVLDLFSASKQGPDLSVLRGLTNLTRFSLFTFPEGSDYNGPIVLEDLSVFGNFTKLTELRLLDVAVTDINPLSNLADLTVLDISNSQSDGRLSDLGPLSSFTNLQELRLADNLVSDLGPLVANQGLGDSNDVVELSGNCLDTSVGSQALADAETIENRNPNVQNVFLGLQRPGEKVCNQPPPPPPGEDCADPVNIPDDLLERAIRKELQKPSGDLTCDDLARLTELDVVEFNEVDDPLSPKSLEGLQFATNLTSLSFYNYDITADYFEPLSGLTNLERLTISNSHFPGDDFPNIDMTFLSDLTNLTYLSLPVTQVGDLSVLAGLTNLTELSVRSSNATDYSPLSGLTKLVRLDLSSDLILGSQLTDLSFLEELTALDDLNLSSNSITDISPLVANPGIGEGDDRIDLSINCLDTSPDSQASQDAAIVERRNPAVVNIIGFDRQGYDCKEGE